MPVVDIGIQGGTDTNVYLRQFAAACYLCLAITEEM
jgi:hypothetical protein